MFKKANTNPLWFTQKVNKTNFPNSYSKNRYLRTWFVLPLFLVPFVFLVLTSTPWWMAIMLLVATAYSVEYTIGKNKPPKDSRNPFLCGWFVGSYLISAYVYFWKIISSKNK